MTACWIGRVLSPSNAPVFVDSRHIMSTNQPAESEVYYYVRITLAMIALAICWHCTDKNVWVFGQLMCWQATHLFLIGRKEIGFRNFGGTDFVVGIFVLYFLIIAPLAYIVSAPALCLAVNKRARRVA